MKLIQKSDDLTEQKPGAHLQIQSDIKWTIYKVDYINKYIYKWTIQWTIYKVDYIKWTKYSQKK